MELSFILKLNFAHFMKINKYCLKKMIVSLLAIHNGSDPIISIEEKDSFDEQEFDLAEDESEAI